MSTPYPIRGPRTNEELFFDYYPQLLEWAAQLTQQGRADAEDLVQDLYIQVAHIGLSLAEVDDLRPYLFKVLRNLHYSRLRQKGRIPISDLSALDYDSLEKGLGAVDLRDLLLVRSDLKQICEFACQRRHTARSANIFLLRFFLGYYASEVMKVVPTTRVGVDKALQFMRREAQEHLDGAGPKGASQRQSGTSSSARIVDHSRVLFLELRQMIFNSCEGPCFDPDALKRRYEEQIARQFTVRELAHLVSCKICLDRVNTILGLPLLDERSPDDTIGRQNPPSASSSEGPQITGRRTAKKADTQARGMLERAKRDWSEHRPISLEVAINGEMRTSQRITAAISEFHLKLNRAEAAEFIEIFSEQGVRLLYLHVLEPVLCPGLEQRQIVELSDGRSLSLTLSFASDLPTVHVIYRDPVFAQLAASEEEGSFDSDATPQDTDREQPDNTAQSASLVQFPARGGLFSSLYAKTSWTWFPRMDPLFATALVLASASIICFVIWLRSNPGMSAVALLDRAHAQDASTKTSTIPAVIYQKVRITSPKRTTERTLYRDAQRRRHMKPRELDAEDMRLKTTLAKAGVDWDDPLSAASFLGWRNRETIRGDSVKRVGPNLLTLTTSVSNDNAVVSESLTVRTSDFHTIGKTVELRNYGTVEIAELNYEVLPWSVVNQGWFEPLATAAGPVSSDVHPALLGHALPHLTDLELDEAELEARLALNHLHADSSERLEIARDNRGIIVKGIVENAVRKQEIEKQLIHISHVTPIFFTFEETELRATRGTDITSVAQNSVVAAPSPLEKYLLANGKSQAEVSQAYKEFFSASVAVNQNSRAWADLLQRFVSREQLTGAARSALEELVRENETGIASALQQQESLLEKIGIALKHGTEDRSLSGSPSDALRACGTRNLALSNELITSTATEPRKAESIAADLSISITQMKAIVNRLHNQFQLPRVSMTASSTRSTQK